jgi:CDP-6-deoxy-D-xylo-4-hexulose-3-dehydrase
MMAEKIYPLASTTWDAKEYSALEDVIKSGMFTMGRHVKEFEDQFATFFGAKYAVMSNSGSSANLLALAAMRYSSKKSFGDRDEVIVPAVSWSTTFYPVTQLGFKLRFVDIDIDSLNMDVSQVKEAIGPKTAGIFAVNLLGNPCDLLALKMLADENGIFLLEDNCESMGAKIGDIYAGSVGEIGTFSSFFSHHISTMEGGMCITNDLELAQIMISMRAHGWTRELPAENFIHNKTGEAFDDLFRFVLPGYNLRPLEMSGAIGKAQLEKLPLLVQARKNNSKFFLKEIEKLEGIRTQREHGESSWFGFSMVLEGEYSGRRREFVEKLTMAGIDSRPIVAGDFTQNPVLKHLPHAALPPLPNAEKVHQDGLFVGNHHFDLSRGISALVSVLASM